MIFGNTSRVEEAQCKSAKGCLAVIAFIFFCCIQFFSNKAFLIQPLFAVPTLFKS